MCGFKPLSYALAFFCLIGITLMFFGGFVVFYEFLQVPKEVFAYNRLAANFRYIKSDLIRQDFKYLDEFNHTSGISNKIETADSFNQNHANYLTQYSPLIYQISAVDFLSKTSIQIIPEKLENVYLNININNLKEKLKLFKFETLDDGFNENECRNINGVWKERKCILIKKLTNSCSKINYQYGKIIFDYSYGGKGCYPQFIRPFVFSHEPERFDTTIPIFNQTNEIDVSFKSTTFTLRHKEDPYLYVLNVSQASPINFPLPTPLFGIGTLYLGILFLVFGFIILDASIIAVIILCSIPSQRRLLFVNMTEEHELLLKLQTEAIRNEKKQETSWSTYLFPSTYE
eukprot:gene2278-2451_t